jgi:membrane-associated protease RseP (regulator of RpoE activity)
VNGDTLHHNSLGDFSACLPAPPPLHYPGPSARDWTLSAVLFLATVASTTFAGGFLFSFTFVSILLAHEMGHFVACRYYGMACTPPYFLPLPITFAGTLGAFIKIKSPFYSRKALFDVGVAGPLAGFVLVIPALVVGIANSELIPRGHTPGISFGEPLLFRWMGKLILAYSPATQDMLAHPIAIGAWFGLLATCLNLLPIWQLDGGHIAYAVLGRERQRRLSLAATAALILVSFAGWPIPSYLLFGLLILGFGLRYRFYHPPTLVDDVGIDPVRRFIALLALIILVVSFTPVPVSYVGR